MHRLRIAVLISGTGRSLKNLIDLISAGRLPAALRLVVSSSPEAQGIEFARQAEIPFAVIRRGEYASTADYSTAIFDACRQAEVDLIVMAGFLKHVFIPPDFRQRVINIHPALIPAFCGKGFYGQRVHEAVLQAGARISGCTVHYVDDEYDHGPIILQRTVPVLDDDSAESLAARVFQEECIALPQAISQIAKQG